MMKRFFKAILEVYPISRIFIFLFLELAKLSSKIGLSPFPVGHRRFIYKILFFCLRSCFIKLCLYGYFQKAYCIKFNVIKNIRSINCVNPDKESVDYLIWERVLTFGASCLKSNDKLHGQNLILLENELFDLINLYCMSEPKVDESFDPYVFLKIVGPLDTDEKLKFQFDQYLLTKPRSGKLWNDRRGIILPNNYSMMNDQFLIERFLRECPGFHLLCTRSRLSVRGVESSFSIGGAVGSAMGLTRSLLCAHAHGAKRVDCSGFDFSLGKLKYDSSYHSAISSRKDLDQIVSRSNYGHDLLFNFMISRVLVKHAFIEVVGPIQNIVSLDPLEFLNKFYLSNFRKE